MRRACKLAMASSDWQDVHTRHASTLLSPFGRRTNGRDVSDRSEDAASLAFPLDFSFHRVTSEDHLFLQAALARDIQTQLFITDREPTSSMALRILPYMPPLAIRAAVPTLFRFQAQLRMQSTSAAMPAPTTNVSAPTNPVSTAPANLPKSENKNKKKGKKPKSKSKSKNSSGKESAPNKTYAMYPNLHDRVTEVLSSVSPPILPQWTFNSQDTSAGTKQEYHTRIMGRFICPKKECTKPGWPSKIIPIVIREYPDRRYNAVVYRQRCRDCNTLGIMKLDEESYVERVVYRLKKWSGVEMDEVEYFGPKEGPEHESEFCEGCKVRKCKIREKSQWMY